MMIYAQVCDRWRCEQVPADAECDPGDTEHSHVSRKHVVRVNSQRREVTHSVELPRHLDRGPLRRGGQLPGARSPRERLVPPPHPLVALDPQAARVQPEVRLTLLAVGQLAQPARQPARDVTSARPHGDVTVVYDVIQVEVGTAAVALRH